jgi:hypothetical protein
MEKFDPRQPGVNPAEIMADLARLESQEARLGYQALVSELFDLRDRVHRLESQLLAHRLSGGGAATTDALIIKRPGTGGNPHEIPR